MCNMQFNGMGFVISVAEDNIQILSKIQFIRIYFQPYKKLNLFWNAKKVTQKTRSPFSRVEAEEFHVLCLKYMCLPMFLCLFYFFCSVLSPLLPSSLTARNNLLVTMYLILRQLKTKGSFIDVFYFWSPTQISIFKHVIRISNET